MGLSKWTNELRKKDIFKKDAFTFSEIPEEYERISSGIIMLDYLTGGGWAKGKINELFGWQSSGKTTASLQTAAWVQRVLGQGVVYIDAEHSLNPQYADNLGVNRDPDIFLSPRANDSEKVATLMKSALMNAKDTNVGLLVLDSAAAIKTGVDPKSEDYNTKTIAERARFWSDFLTELTSLVTEAGVTLLFVNQVRQNIAAGRFATESEKEHPTGGNALEFYKVVSVKMEQGKIEKKEGKDEMTGEKVWHAFGQWTSIKVKKNKAGGDPENVQKAFINFGAGFDNAKTAAAILSNHGIVRYEGKQYVFTNQNGKDVAASTMEEIEDALAKDPEFTNAMLKDLGFKFDYEYRR